MERREFLAVAGTVAVGYAMRNSEVGARNSAGEAVPNSAFRVPPFQDPTLGPAVFAQRVQRLQEELKRRKLDLLVAEPSTNFQYFTGYNPGRSERLILLMLPATGNPVVVCPSFEVERIKRNSAIADVRGWEEQDNPWNVVKTVGREMKPPRRHGAGAVLLGEGQQTHDEPSLGGVFCQFVIGMDDVLVRLIGPRCRPHVGQ